MSDWSFSNSEMPTIRMTEAQKMVDEAYNQGRVDERNRTISMTRNYLGCYDNECENCYFKIGECCKFDNLWEQLRE